MATVSGAVSGALSATGLGKWAQAFGNAGISIIAETASQIQSGTFGTDGSGSKIATAALAGFVGGLIGGDGMRHETNNYYKAAQEARETALKVYGKQYGNPHTPAKLLGRVINKVRTVGYRESQITGAKFLVGSINAQFLTRRSQSK